MILKNVAIFIFIFILTVFLDAIFFRLITKELWGDLLPNLLAFGTIAVIIWFWIFLGIPGILAYYLSFGHKSFIKKQLVGREEKESEIHHAKDHFQRKYIVFVLVFMVAFFVIADFLFNPIKGITYVEPYAYDLVTTESISSDYPLKLSITSLTEDVAWLTKPKKVESVGFFSLIDSHYPYKEEFSYDKLGNQVDGVVKGEYESNSTYYLVGKVKNGQYKDGSVYLGLVGGLPETDGIKAPTSEDDIKFDKNLSFLFIKMPDNTFVVTNDYNNPILFSQGSYETWTYENRLPKTEETGIDSKTGIKIDKEVRLDEIGSATDNEDSNSEIDFNTSPTYALFNLFDPSGLYLVKNLDDNAELYSNQNVQENPLKLKTVVNPKYVIKLPTGLEDKVRSGHYGGGFILQKGSADRYNPYYNSTQIIWTSQDRPALLTEEPTKSGIGDYSGIIYTDNYDGCSGNMTLENSFLDSEVLDVQNNLVQVASTDKGDKIYDIKNKDFKIFQQFRFWKVESNGLANLSYGDYLSLKPILIQKDTFGIYHMLFRAELVASQCWSEPLIYLYPQQKTNVQIKLNNIINISESEPTYDLGWNVIAYPDGKIFDIKKQRYYPYLYWEGSVPGVLDPVIIDVVSQKDIHSYFNNQLTKLGLNDKEKSDFENYWEPQLKAAPYYLISFYESKALNKIVSLNISPKPDTLIRILMSYEELNSKIDIHKNNNNYKTPVRKGFTVVEWGGILHK